MSRLAGSDRGRRAQLLLVAAGVVALALAPILFAYLQLGAQPTAPTAGPAPLADTERTLGRAVHEAGAAATDQFDWPRRGRAVEHTQDLLEPRLRGVERARVEQGTVITITYNATAARQHAQAACPSGPAREFGPCEARAGVVIQRRLGRTHVLAVALDVRVVGTDRRANATFVLPTIEGAPADPDADRSVRS